jgi:GTP-binding protein of the ras superfamily involved in termination of M-phase
MVANAQTAIPVLIGTKYDTFAGFPREEQEEITKQAKRFSKAMHAPLVSATECNCTSAADVSDLLLNISFHQCSKDL